jgi:hypothetical protein
MKKTKIIPIASKVIPLSHEAKKRLRIIGESLKGKELFPKMIESAKMILKNVKSLPK